MAKNRPLFRKVKDKNMEKLSLEKKAELFDKFIKFYAKDVPFGSMPKTNTDAFIYGLLEETEYLEDCKTTQDIAIKLKITPAKVRNLMLNSALHKGFAVDTISVLEYLGTSAKYSKDGFISIDFDNPVIRMELKKICSERKIYTDGGFNANILKFKIENYSELLNSFVSDEKKLKTALLEQIKEAKWDITAQQIAEHPILKILEKGASLATGGSSEIVPTDIVVKAIVKAMKFKEKMKKPK